MELNIETTTGKCLPNLLVSLLQGQAPGLSPQCTPMGPVSPIFLLILLPHLKARTSSTLEPFQGCAFFEAGDRVMWWWGGWTLSFLWLTFLGIGPSLSQITGRVMNRVEVKTVLKSCQMAIGMTTSASR